MDWSSWGAPPQGAALVLHALSANADLDLSENFNSEAPQLKFRTLSEPAPLLDQLTSHRGRGVHSAGLRRYSVTSGTRGGRRKSQLLDDVHQCITGVADVDPVPAKDEVPVSQRIAPHEEPQSLEDSPNLLRAQGQIPPDQVVVLNEEREEPLPPQAEFQDLITDKGWSVFRPKMVDEGIQATVAPDIEMTDSRLSEDIEWVQNEVNSISTGMITLPSDEKGKEYDSVVEQNRQRVEGLLRKISNMELDCQELEETYDNGTEVSPSTDLVHNSEYEVVELNFESDDSEGRLRYVGQMQTGRKHGLGVMTWIDGAQFEGEFKHDVAHGLGCERYSDGTVYMGQFRNDERHGVGVSTTPDGKEYCGYWNAGDLNGPGFEVTQGISKFWHYNLGKRVAEYKASQTKLTELVDKIRKTQESAERQSTNATLVANGQGTEQQFLTIASVDLKSESLHTFRERFMSFGSVDGFNSRPVSGLSKDQVVSRESSLKDLLGPQESSVLSKNLHAIKEKEAQAKAELEQLLEQQNRVKSDLEALKNEKESLEADLEVASRTTSEEKLRVVSDLEQLKNTREALNAEVEAARAASCLEKTKLATELEELQLRKSQQEGKSRNTIDSASMEGSDSAGMASTDSTMDLSAITVHDLGMETPERIAPITKVDVTAIRSPDWLSTWQDRVQTQALHRRKKSTPIKLNTSMLDGWQSKMTDRSTPFQSRMSGVRWPTPSSAWSAMPEAYWPASATVSSASLPAVSGAAAEMAPYVPSNRPVSAFAVSPTTRHMLGSHNPSNERPVSALVTKDTVKFGDGTASRSLILCSDGN